MAPVIPDPSRIKSFRTEATFERWLAKHHNSEPELWLRIYKKGSGKATVTYAEALDVSLCWGWIDGLKKSFDDDSFLQRFTPRKPKSVWSQVNRGHIARLTKAGRMNPHGQKHVDSAKADGRWDAAYASIKDTNSSTVPVDLMKAINANRRAKKTFATLSKTNLFSIVYRTNAMKTPAGRMRKIESIVAMLANGETTHPQKR